MSNWSQWVETQPVDQCLLKALVAESPRVRTSLTRVSNLQLQQAIAGGLMLRQQWPRPWGNTLANYIGQRLYLSHAEHFTHSRRLTAVVSSALGRGKQQLRSWPLLLDHALQHIARHGQRLLLVPRTTTCTEAAEFAQRARVPVLRAIVDNIDQVLHGEAPAADDECTWDVDSWLSRSLDTAHAARDNLLISPPWLVEQQPAFEEWNRVPLQDRVSILLSDSVMALRVRYGGTVARLLKERLTAPEYLPGSTYCAVTPPNATEARAASSTRPVPTSVLMESGAVGWFLLNRSHRELDWSLPCNQSRPATQQIVVRLPQDITAGTNDSTERSCDDTDWPWLSHCTRGASGPRPTESQAQYRDRVWLAGSEDAADPFQSLMRICCTQQLCGSTWTTRTDQPSVSLSAVPLPELLSRRVFRSHLGRWDWEPYGVAVRREWLLELGGQPVIYGAEQDYKQLDESQRPFFQPRTGSPSRKRGESPSTENDWSLEQEWRLLGNLNLQCIPPEKWFCFTRTAREAQQLSQITSCPVYWIGE